MPNKINSKPQAPKTKQYQILKFEIPSVFLIAFELVILKLFGFWKLEFDTCKKTMTNKFKLGITAIATTAMALSAIALPAFAQVGGLTITANGSTSVGIGAVGAAIEGKTAIKATLEDQAVTRAGTEITNRIDALNALAARINAMQKLSSEEKTNLSSSIQAQVTAMTALQAQIAADQSSNNTSSLKTDIQSITKAYRIYALILPQGNISAAADRIMTITDAMTTLATSLQARITAAQSAGANVSSSITVLTDLRAKSADANTQATAAMAHISTLTPDNGSSTLMASNTAALKLARSDIQVAQQDLVKARQDATTIIKTIKAAEKVTASASTTVSGTSTSQQ